MEIKPVPINMFAPGKAHAGQIQVLEDPTRFKLLRAGRKWRKTSLGVSWLFEEAIKDTQQRKFAFILPYQNQARDSIWNDHVKRALNEFDKKGLKYRKNESTMEITLQNKSTFKLYGSDNEAGLRSISNLGAIVIDEYDDCSPTLWNLTMRPNLMVHQAPAIIMGCVTKDTMILSSGLEKIGTTPVGYTDIDKQVYGLGGYHKAIQRYGNGKTKTIKIKSQSGFDLEGTPNHRVWTPKKWKRLDKLEINDEVNIQFGQEDFGTETLSKDDAYLLGLFVAEGSWEIRGRSGRVTITNPDCNDFLLHQGFKDRGDKLHYRSSKHFNFFKKYVTIAKSKDRYLMPKTLKLDKESTINFLSGYFDGDGFGDRKRARVGSSSTSQKLTKQIQLMLLNLGIRAKLSVVVSQPTKKVKVESTGYRLSLEGHDAFLFYRDIGFRIPRKQENQKQALKCNLDRRRGVAGNFFVEKIIDIKDSENYTYDFVIPETHSYFSNGFVSHNTPKGKRGMYKIEVENKEFKPFHFTSYDNPDLPRTELDELVEDYKRQGDDVYLQEIMAEYRKPAGVVFPEFNIDTHVVDPFEIPNHWEVFRGVDLGENNPTAIIWIAVDPNGNWYCYDEYYDNHKTTSEYVEEMLIKTGKRKVRATVLDENGLGKQLLLDWNTYGANAIGQRHLKITDGVARVREKIRPNQFTNKPSFYIFKGKCPNLIMELENFRYKESKDDYYRPEQFEPGFDHLISCLRNIAVTFFNTRAKNYKDDDDDDRPHRRTNYAVSGITGY